VQQPSTSNSELLKTAQQFSNVTLNFHHCIAVSKCIIGYLIMVHIIWHFGCQPSYYRV